MQRIFPEMKLSAVITLRLVLLFGFAQIASAQAPPTPLPLSLDNNYMVTGDYVVGGWTKGPSIGINGMSNGTINIPDPIAYGGANLEQKVPQGADIVAAFLYWGTVESSGVHSGQIGTFNTYPISGTVLGNPNAPVSWSSGGCAGAANGSKTIVTYRAEVSALLPVDANGNIQPIQLSLPDTGKAGQPPYTLGATLVVVYRMLAPTAPLTSVVIYDGAFAPSNTSQTMTQPIQGFYQAGNDQPPPPGQLRAPIVTKITHIVANGQANKLQQVFLNNYDAQGKLVHSTVLPSLYGNNPPFPGNNYNTPWDNPTWFPNTYATTPIVDTAVQAGESSETTLVVPNGTNKGCVSWGAVVFSTTVQDSDFDGLIDVWKTNQGYCDAGANRGMSNQGVCAVGDHSWVSLRGANSPPGKHLFIQLDYMCTKVFNNADGTTTCDTSGVSYKPSNDPITNQDPISNLVSAFGNHNITVHVVSNDNNVILAQPCSDTVDANNNPVYCPHPGQAGVVDWKLGFTALKVQPLNYPDETTCDNAGSLCVRRFPPGQNNSYHEAIFAVASATPDWYFLNGTLASISASGNTLTFTTSAPHGLAADPTNKGVPNSRITVFGAISNPSLNGTYLVQSVPSTTSFTIQLTTATAAPTNVTDPSLSVSAAVVGAASGVSDIGGADSLISLGLWGVDGQTVPVESGTFMHELGHSLGLTHGGLYRTDLGGGNYSFSSEPNCKPNFQSVMNYMFQVDLLDGVLDYSNQDLQPPIDEITGSAAPSVLANLIHPTTDWYAPNQPFGSPATAHCDGTPLLPTDPPPPGGTFLLQGPARLITWAANQDLNFDGQHEAALDGYDDWDNLDLRQIGATGNYLWAAGRNPIVLGGGGRNPIVLGGGGRNPIVLGGGGVGEATLKTVSSNVRKPKGDSVAPTPTNTINVKFTAAAFGQSQIAYFNIYRTTTQVFSKPAYATFPAAGMQLPPLPLPDPLTFTDTNVSCGVNYSYFVTTVLSDGRESVQSNTLGPISVPCQFVGFLSPLSTASQAPAPPTFSGQRNLGTAGTPVKWELLGANNQPISDLTTLRLMQACSTMGPLSAPGSGSVCVPIYSPLTGGEGSTTFRYSAPNFIVNWDTGSLSGLAPGVWTLELQLSDGRMYWTNIQFH